jgi:hypothetical protein
VTDEIAIRPYAPGDERGLVDCYNAVFPLADETLERQDLALWAWKFDDSLTGLRHIVVADHATEGIVGAYPSQPLRVWIDGRTRLTAQIVDLMVRPEFRRHGARPGLFVHLGRRLYELYCGASGEDRQVFNYGWPIPAWRVGRRYLDYLNIRDWNVLYKDLGGARTTPDGPGELETVEVDRFDEQVDRLFERTKLECGLTLVRDSAYLNWRYADHPRRDYHLFACRERSTGVLRGVAVYGVGDFLRPNTSFLVDWVVPGADRDAIFALVGAAEARALVDRTGTLAGTFSPIDPRFQALQTIGYALMDTSYFIVVATFSYDTVYFRQNWIYTMGDSDLV